MSCCCIFTTDYELFKKQEKEIRNQINTGVNTLAPFMGGVHDLLTKIPDIEDFKILHIDPSTTEGIFDPNDIKGCTSIVVDIATCDAEFITKVIVPIINKHYIPQSLITIVNTSIGIMDMTTHTIILLLTRIERLIGIQDIKLMESGKNLNISFSNINKCVYIQNKDMRTGRGI